MAAPDIYYEFKDLQGFTVRAEVLEVVFTASEVRVSLENPSSIYAGYVEGRGSDLESAVRDAGQMLPQ